MNFKHTFLQIKLFLKEHNTTILSMLACLVLVDIFMIPGTSDFRTFGLLLVYIIDSMFVKRTSKITFLACLGLLIVMYIAFLVTGTSPQTEKAAVWLYLMLLLGVVQLWKE